MDVPLVETYLQILHSQIWYAPFNILMCASRLQLSASCLSKASQQDKYRRKCLDDSERRQEISSFRRSESSRPFLQYLSSILIVTYNEDREVYTVYTRTRKSTRYGFLLSRGSQG